MERIGGWSARHRKTAVFGWLLLVAVVIVAGHSLPAKTVPSYDAGQSGQAELTLNKLHLSTHPAEAVLIEARVGGTFATDPALRQATRQIVTALHDLPGSATGIRSPFSPGGAALISADGRGALVTFTIPGTVINPGQARNEDQTVTADLSAVAAVQGRHPGLLITEAGDASEDKAITRLLNSDFSKAEVTSVPITLILLLLVFGALIAAGIPLLLALTSVAAAISLLSVPGQWLPVGQNAREVVLLIGMAVGVDYSLFYLRREREERAKGATVAQAIRTAAATSGRTIVVSGLTVMTALAGLFLTGYSGFIGSAVGAIAVVGIAVAGSLTVLPALLSWLGTWADRTRVPFLGRRRTAARPSRVWAALARRVVRRPLLWGGAAAIAMLALAAPALGMRLTYPATDVPSSTPIVQSFNAIQRAFPQAPMPAQVVVTGTDLAGPQVRAAVAALQGRATAGGPIRGPITATQIGGGRALIIDVPLAGNGSSTASDDALTSLRSKILPATLGQVSGIRYAVGGETASTYDDTKALDARTPLVLGAVAVLAFLVLLISFRSITLPLVSIGLNMLSVGAAFGLITLIFQDGRLQSTLGYTSFGAITSWVPLFLFVFLFGLSMDYHVFILSRIRELRGRGTPTRQAITDGIASSAGVVTSAAVIMVAVFSIFATLHLVELKMLGIGLPAAILIDATIVRGILVPAAMALLDERCWYLPRWLRWLPGAPAAADQSR